MRALCPGRLRRYRRLMRQLLRALGQKLRLHDAVARLTAREARMVEERPVEADQRRDPADLELLEGAKHAPARVLAVDAVDDQLRHERVVEPGDLRPRGHSRVDANPRTRRLAVSRDPPRAGQEAVGRILGVDPALDRVTGQPDVLLA